MNNCFEAPQFHDIGIHHFWGLKYVPGDEFHADAYEANMIKVIQDMLSDKKVSIFWQVYGDNFCEFRFLEILGLKPDDLSEFQQTTILNEIIRLAEDFMNDPENRQFYEVD